jgi:hypothetical protein
MFKCGWYKAIVLLLITAATVCAADEPSGKRKVEAALLSHFSDYIEWPAGTFAADGDPFVVGVVGDESFGNSVAAVMKDVNGRSPKVVNFAGAKDFALPCQILFVAPELNGSMGDILAKCANAPVLIVTDAEGMAAKGAVVNFVMADNHVHLEVNVDAAERAKLKISSKLLKLVKVIHDDNK